MQIKASGFFFHILFFAVHVKVLFILIKLLNMCFFIACSDIALNVLTEIYGHQGFFSRKP